MSQMHPKKLKTILIKVSGGCLKDDLKNETFDHGKLVDLAEQIQELQKEYRVGLVIGGGNIWRGCENYIPELKPQFAHYVGMLATVMNGLVLQNVFSAYDIKTKIFSALNCSRLTHEISPKALVDALDDKQVLIFTGGTGMPFLSTDTCAAIRAVEIGASKILMGKNHVKGVYDGDPRKDPNAKFLANLNYNDLLIKDLKVMDATALTICKENEIELLVFNQDEKHAFVRALKNEIEFTKITKK